MLESLFQTYDSVIVLDTETTGVNCKSDEIIELGFLRLDRAGERTEEDYLIRLSPGRRLPPVITQLTGEANVGVFSLVILFIVGFVLLRKVPEHS